MNSPRASRTVIARRVTREPVALIVGSREFWGRDFAVTRATLVPAPRDRAHRRRSAADPASRFSDDVDIGTGTGCLAITLAAERAGCARLRDRYFAEALLVAAANARTHRVADRVRFVRMRPGRGAWIEAGIVVSNPPYVPEAVAPSTPLDVVNYEPPPRSSADPTGLRSSTGCSRVHALLAPGGASLLNSATVRRAASAPRRSAKAGRCGVCSTICRVSPAPSYWGGHVADCLFCKIVSGDIPASIVYRDEHLVAFKDINPQAPLHVLIVPQAPHPDAERSRSPGRRPGRARWSAAPARSRGSTATRTGATVLCSIATPMRARRCFTFICTSSAGAR